MKELDKFKEDWKSREGNYPKLDKDALYQLILKRSSSIVKWLFYISIAEFVFWTSISVLTHDNKTDQLIEQMHLSIFIKVLSVINYAVLIYFITLFYRNYKRVTFTASSKELIERILKVKRTVTQYVWFNLFILGISLLAGFFGLIHYGPESEKIFNMAAENGNSIGFWVLITVICLVFIGVILFFLWGFYRILYGILLKKLKNNHRELQRLEH